MVRHRHKHPHHGDRPEELLRCLAHAVRLVSLYTARHPVASAAINECLSAFRSLVTVAGQAKIAVALIEGRWVIDGKPIASNVQVIEGLLKLFRAHNLHSATFLAAMSADELAAFCEFLSCPSGNSGPAEFLRRHTILNIQVNADRFSRATAKAARPPIESPISAARAYRGACADSRRRNLSGMPLGSFIKSLVDESVPDQEERARIYADILDSVKSALARKVAESTKALQDESRRSQEGRQRLEKLLATAAEGRVVVDKDGRVLMMDPIAEAIAGRPLSALAGKPILDNVDDSRHIVTLASPSLRGEVRVAGDQELLGAMRQATAVVQDEEGRVVGTYGIAPYIAKLREAARAKDEFIANVTHDLKAPLSAIISALEIITRDAAGKLTAQENRFLDVSLKNTRQLTHMINELLDMARLQSGRMPLLPLPTPLDPLLHEAVEGMRPWAASKGLSLAVAGTSALTVVADRSRMLQVLTNLISNSIKSTPEGGSITVGAGLGADARAGKAVVAVSDTGHGIPLEMQRTIFDKFTQAAPRHQRREGVGLGLSIVREFISRHGGEVWVESAPGLGAVFSFTLALAEH